MKKARLFLFAFGIMGVLALSFFPVQEVQARSCKGGIRGTWPNDIKCVRVGNNCTRACGFLEFK